MAMTAPIVEIQQRIDHESDEDYDDADREADRPERRRREVRLLVGRFVLGVGTRLFRLHRCEVLPQTPTERSGN